MTKHNWNEEAEGHIFFSGGLRIDLLQTIEAIAARLKRDHDTIATLTAKHAALVEEVKAWRVGWNDDRSDSWDSPLGRARARTDASGAMENT